MGAQELVLPLDNPVHQRIDNKGIFAHCPGRHLPVKDLGVEVGVVGRHLAPADAAVVDRHTDEVDEFVAEGFERLDLYSVTLRP